MNQNLPAVVEYLHPGAFLQGQVVIQDDGAGPYLKVWNLPGSPPTDQEIADAIAAIPAATSLASRVAAKNSIDAVSTPARLHRAVVSLLVDELNVLRGWTRNFEAAVAASATLAELKTRIANLTDLSDRTNIQAFAAIKAAIDQEA